MRPSRFKLPSAPSRFAESAWSLLRIRVSFFACVQGFLRGVFVADARLSQADVRNSIEHRMLDSSPAVRDTAIELVGKYVAERPDLAVQYLPQISERITVRSFSSPAPTITLTLVYLRTLDWVFGVVSSSFLRRCTRSSTRKSSVSTSAASWSGAYWTRTMGSRYVAPPCTSLARS